MGLSDKLENAKDDLVGKAKEATGKATGDEQMQAEGDLDQRKSDVKKAGENVKDAVTD
ncbi:conserved hypothetical protein [Nostocoides japonicum T1-X7]|uniref:CsbD-like domain-containing protein n=1 Tax=Nostocoides japonicum T1-X7 TaxID=1194083 RepID=A0A077M0S5_9MICO|nr:CsbD family protein [Tetrasphaera japonica]CCH77794.1 conserved hypothetical protein [Tetrasphaera japonica T1-X7]